MEIVAATKNRHKIEEIQNITEKFGIKIISRDMLIDPNIEIIEDGETFEENSLKKAIDIMKLCGKTSISDDSGLMVDVLNGAPGVISARFAGEEADDDKNNQKLLELLKDIPMEKRTAKFVSVITLAYTDGKIIQTYGECLGHIIFEEKGQNGFGYDPLFVPIGFHNTFAELSGEEKNKISHRSKALEKLKEELGSIMS